MQKSYVDTRHGQVHLRRVMADVSPGNRALICLHPAPSSGLYFETVMPLLASERTVMAPDYPGYGGSDVPESPPTINDYAEAMLDVLTAHTSDDEPMDILGFHTGCLVAVEMALVAPERIGKLILCDVPYFSADVRPGLLEKMAVPLSVNANLDSLEKAWEFNITKRLDAVPMARALPLFAEHLRSGQSDYFGFSAAFRYDCETQFSKLDRPVSIVATKSGLLDPSRAAADALPNAQLFEALEITTAVFESGAPSIAKHVLRCLDENDE